MLIDTEQGTKAMPHAANALEVWDAHTGGAPSFSTVAVTSFGGMQGKLAFTWHLSSGTVDGNWPA